MSSEISVWEYAAFKPRGLLFHPDDIAQWLSGPGRDGWELVLRDDHGNWVFKRPAAKTVAPVLGAPLPKGDDVVGSREPPVARLGRTTAADETMAEVVARRRGVRIK